MSIEVCNDLLHKVTQIAKEAGDKIKAYYNQQTEITIKEDGSPLTQADLAAHNHIIQRLKVLTSEIPIISEENNKDENAYYNNAQQFWLVDPLDGTKEFLNKNGEFTVNIALIQNGNPILGVVAAPALNTIYLGGETLGAFRISPTNQVTEIQVQKIINNQVNVVGSRSHSNQKDMDTFLLAYKVKEFIPTGSSLKFCKIAEGLAQLYPRLGRTMEWDTAAGHAVLKAAGGLVERIDGMPLTYGKPNFENPHFLARA